MYLYILRVYCSASIYSQLFYFQLYYINKWYDIEEQVLENKILGIFKLYDGDIVSY